MGLVTPPDEPMNLPEDLMNQEPAGPTQPIPATPEPGAPPPTAPYAEQPPAYGQPDYGQQPPSYGQPAYGQPAYGQPQPPYGQGGYAPPVQVAPNHPQAQTAMILGLVGLIGTFICGITIFLCPFAWVMGGRAKREIDASGGAYGGRDQAMVGYVTGIIGTVLLALGLLALVFVIVIAAIGTSTSSGGI